MPAYDTSSKLDRRSHYQRARARLSDRQKKALQEQHRLSIATAWIKRLYKISNTHASDFERIEVKNGYIRVGKGNWIKVASFDATINYTVCGAVIKGVLTTLPASNDEMETKVVEDKPWLSPNNNEIPVDFYIRATTGHTPSTTYEPVTVEPEPKPEPTDKYERLMKKFHELRAFCERGEHSDKISTGSLVNGFKMLEGGISQEAILHALTITWPDTVRAKVNISSYDPAEFGNVTNGYHRLAPYVVKLAEVGIPILLVGPTQVGKSTLAEHVAEILGKEFGGASPLTGGASPSWLLGRDRRDGFLPASFINSYKDGKVHLLDEMDAADGNMLMVLNNAITSDHFDHPYMGRIDKHPDFVLIAAANTWGTGATKEYTDRNKLDKAIQERFRLGRVFMDYDPVLESKIMAKFQARLDK